MNYTLVILGMAVVTFLIKATIFILGGRVAFPPILQQALGFVPVTVLTAIIVPMILAPHGAGMELDWRNPQLIASIAAVMVAAGVRRQLVTIGVGLAIFFVWQLWVVA